MAKTSWAFTHEPPTFADLYNLAQWRKHGRGQFFTPEVLSAMAALLVSRDRSDPRHTLDDVMVLEYDDLCVQIDAMMKGLVEGRTTIDLMNAFKKEGL